MTDAMYTMRVTFPDGCAVEYRESGGADGYPLAVFLPVKEGHEHPNDPDAGAIHRAAGRAFLAALAETKSQAETPA